MQNNKYNKNVIRKRILHMMLPIIVENFLQLMTDLIATAMVGRLTEVDIAAQGMSMKIVNFVYYIFKGSGLALVVIVAKNLAQNKVSACRTVFEKIMLASICIGIIIGGLIYIIPEPAIKIFTNDNVLITHAVEYIRVLVFCLPFWGVNVCVSSVFQGKGDTRTPMMIAFFVNLLNLALCYGLIFGNFGMPELGYKGAAASLLISRMVGSIVGVIMLYNNTVGIFSWQGKRERVDNVLFEVYSLGLPSSGESAVWQVASILLSRVIFFYGQSAFAAYQLGVQAEYITEIPAIGFSVAAISLISKAIAVDDRELFYALKKELVRICVLISIVTSLLLVLFPHMFMRALTNNAELARIGIPYVAIMGLIQIPQNLIKIYAGILRSTGYKMTSLIIEMFGTWCLRLTCAFGCAYIFNLPLVSIWICIAVDQLIKFFLIKYQVDHKEMFRESY